MRAFSTAAHRRYSLGSSSSGVGFWKKAIQGFIISSEIWKAVGERSAFLCTSRRSNSSAGTSGKCTSLPAPSCLARKREVFSFFPRPKAKIKNHIRSQHKRPTGQLPKQGLNERMPGVMPWFFGILTEELQLPFIGRESKRRAFMFELSRQRCFS